MLIQPISRTDPETVYSIVRNVAGATITAGYPVVWDISATIDGNRVSKPATASLSSLVGIADETAADSAYFKVQIYGYRSEAYLTNDTSVAVAAGDILIPVNAQWYLARSGAADGKSGFLTAGEAFATAATPAAANKKILIRCM